MKTRTAALKIQVVSMLLVLLITACQAATPPPAPTPTPQPTPTITPTPAPQEMEIMTLLENCKQLADQKASVILTGKVFLPDETVYGYTGWYGMDLISTTRIAALFQVGSGPNTMNDLPHFFFEQDLVIRADDDVIIRHGFEVRVTGRPKYRTDSETRQCEVFVDKVESLMPAEVLLPKDLTFEELLNGNNKDECKDLEYTRQFVRLHGTMRVDIDSSFCQIGNCTISFVDSTGEGTARILEGEGANHMASLPSPFSNSDLKVWNYRGELVQNSNVFLVGPVRKTDSGCEIIVYEVEKGD